MFCMSHLIQQGLCNDISCDFCVWTFAKRNGALNGLYLVNFVKQVKKFINLLKYVFFIFHSNILHHNFLKQTWLFLVIWNGVWNKLMQTNINKIILGLMTNLRNWYLCILLVYWWNKMIIHWQSCVLTVEKSCGMPTCRVRVDLSHDFVLKLNLLLMCSL